MKNLMELNTPYETYQIFRKQFGSENKNFER